MFYQTNLTTASYCSILLVIVCPVLIGIACIRNLIPWSSSNPNVFSWAQILEYVCVMVLKCPLGEATTHGLTSGWLLESSSLNLRPLYWLPTVAVTSCHRICTGFFLLEPECHKSKSQVAGELYALGSLGDLLSYPFNLRVCCNGSQPHLSMLCFHLHMASLLSPQILFHSHLLVTLSPSK